MYTMQTPSLRDKKNLRSSESALDASFFLKRKNQAKELLFQNLALINSEDKLKDGTEVKRRLLESLGDTYETV